MAFALTERVQAVETGYGLVLLDERAGRYWRLNETGTVVVAALLAGDAPEQAAGQLARRFDITEDDARRDVAALVDGLRAAGLVAA